MDYQLIVAIVKRGNADEVIDTAKEAGVTGATIFYARGTSIHEPHPFLGIRLTSEREVVMVIVPREDAQTLLERIVERTELEQPGNGVAFLLPLDRVMGIVHQQSDLEESGD